MLLPRTAWLGALGGIGIMTGAIGAHLTKLGLEVQGDGGLLFFLALAVLATCLLTLYLHRNEARQFVKGR